MEEENVNNNADSSATPNPEEKISAKKEIGAAAANDFKQCAEPFKQFKEPSFFKDFLNFDVLITPMIIKALFYILTIVGIVYSIEVMRNSVMLGLIYLVLSPLSARISCEFMYVIFGIFDNLKEAKEALKEINQKTK